MGRSYWNGLGNIPDVVKILVGITYLIFAYFDCDEKIQLQRVFESRDNHNYNTISIQSLTFSILISLQWLYLLGHLRFSEDMRGFIEILERVFLEIWTFLTLFFIFLFAVHDFLFFKN